MTRVSFCCCDPTGAASWRGARPKNSVIRYKSNFFKILASFDNATSAFNVKPRGDKGDVSKIQDLGTMGKGHRPKLRGWSKYVNEAFAITRSDFRPVGNPDEVCMPIIAKSGVEIFPGGDEQRLNKFSSLT